jgi:aryl-alcohol dehydrogenase-like predicted oxidoreductase
VEYRQLGDSGLRVSEICLGTWTTFGGSLEDDDAIVLVDAAFQNGINFFDTANVYSEGRSEEVLGRALAGRPRDSFVVATKVYGQMPNGDRGLSREQVLKQIDDSLGRLQLDYVDLYQCHSWDADVPVEETLGALTEVGDAGKARFIGVSNWSGDQIRGGVELARERGFAKIVSSQPPYSLLDREAEEDVIPASREVAVSQIVYSPLAQGVLSGKYPPGESWSEGTRAAARGDGFIAVPGRRRARAGAAPRSDRRHARRHDGSACARLDPPRAKRRERDRRRVAAGATARQRGRVGRCPRRRHRASDRRRNQ